MKGEITMQAVLITGIITFGLVALFYIAAKYGTHGGE